MKKLLVLLLISVLALFVFASCTTPPTPSEGEGEGEVEAAVLDIVDDVIADGKNWVKGGKTYDFTVTLAVPTDNVYAYNSDCTGDYSKSSSDSDTPIVLWPNADKTVWSGSVKFTCDPCDTGECVEYSGCCASVIFVEFGDCDWCATSLPVLVDCEDPWARLELCMDDCDCAGCELSFTTDACTSTCDPSEDLCGDSHDEDELCPGCDDVYDCSGLASWSLAIYPDDPYDVCCDVPCEEPIWSASGTDCPISAVTDCMTEYAGFISGYTTVCEEECVIEETEVCLAYTVCYCESDTDEEGCIDNPEGENYLCPCECEEELCCEWGIETEEVCTITCEDTPIYDCNWLFVVLTMVDNVGNDAKYGAWIASSNYPDCDNVCIVEVVDHPCLDDACGVFVNASSSCDCPNVTCTCELPI